MVELETLAPDLDSMDDGREMEEEGRAGNWRKEQDKVVASGTPVSSPVALEYRLVWLGIVAGQSIEECR